MIREIRNIRQEHLVIAKLMELWPDANIERSGNGYVDLIITLPYDKAQFGVVTVSEDYLGTPAYLHFCHELLSEQALACIEGRTIMLASVDNNLQLKMAYLLSWNLDQPHLIDNPQFINITEESAKAIAFEIRKQFHNIQLLDQESMMVMKRYVFDHDRYNQPCAAELIYLRRLSDDYCMSPIPECLSLQDRFMRNVNGRPQEEYPEDDLDSLIYEALKTEYLNLGKPTSSLIATTTEYRSLLRYCNYQHDTADFRIFPDIMQLPENVRMLLGKVEGIKFNVDIYMMFRNPKNAYANEGFELRLPMNNWFETIEKYSRLLTTLHKVSEII